MYKCKLHIIIIFVLLILVGCTDHRSNIKPKAESGVMDLTQIQLKNDVVSIDGEWEFFWNQLLAPARTSLYIPLL
jgi:two-component system sensor histidine kinase ChiS